VIIISLVWFLLVKKIKLKFYKIHKIKPKPVQTDQFGFGYFILKTKIQLIGFGSIQINFGAVRFGSVRLLILKTKNYIIFFGFFGLSNGLGFGLVFLFFGLVGFGFPISGCEPFQPNSLSC
jgi:hypothetical protein